MTTNWPRLASLAVLTVGLSASPPAAAQTPQLLPHRLGRHATSYITAITLATGSGKVLTLSGKATNVFVADPKVAEVRPASPDTLFVFGIAPGQTTVAALAADGHVLGQYQISVFPSDFAASEAEVAVQREMPGLHVQVHSQGAGLTVTGQVQTPEEQERVVDIVDGFLGTGQSVRNEIGVTSATQVTLQVRIAEMSRTVARQLGVNWQAVAAIGSSTLAFASLNPLPGIQTATGSSAISYGSPNANVVIDALAQDSLAKILAEPNLTVMSGQPGSFFVGGEFPIPVGLQNNEVSIEFKRYGVSLDFVPTVLSSGRINLHVRPEVSELTNTGAVQLGAGNSTFSIPALLVRRAETTVELGSGQSFAIAGLLQDSDTNSSSGTPVLGDVPVLGALFRSNSLNRSETELVILITPYIVRPVNDPAALTIPGGDTPSPNDLGRVLLLRQMGQAPSTLPLRIPGQAGYMVQ